MTLKKSLFLLIPGVIVMFLFTPADAVMVSNGFSHEELANSQYEKTLWGIGKNLNEGDSFYYRICDSLIPKTVILSHCYDVKLTFVSLMESYKGPVWIVQGAINPQSNPEFFILQINSETFEVESDKLNVDFARSLENTVFSLAKYGDNSLSVGTVWDDLDSYFTNSIPFEMKRHETISLPFATLDTSVLSYDIIEESNYFIVKSFPFPVKAAIYSPNIIFPEPLELFNYELVDSINLQVNAICHDLEMQDMPNFPDHDFEDFFNDSFDGSLDYSFDDSFDDLLLEDE